MLEHVTRRGLEMLVARDLEERGLLVAFTGREGGTSSGPFSSLNLSYNVGDDRRAVSANRRKVADSLGVPREAWVLPRQVHGRSVAVAGRFEAGRGASDFDSGIPRTDGLVTIVPGMAVAVLTADCLPVALIAPGGPGVAVAHAGWRGVLAGVAVITARKLAESTDSSFAEILAFIGPHIGSCCMEAGPEVADRFARHFGEEVARSSVQGKSLIDLQLAVELQLTAAGIEKKNIFGAGACTLCGQGYFSHRASADCGRQGAFAALLDTGGGR
jgi:purine-nucleoside/S-methyl-5'-thioadenosine phosphorylase / adenosine deaminase